MTAFPVTDTSYSQSFVPRSQQKPFGFTWDFTESLTVALTDSTMRLLSTPNKTVTEAYDIRRVSIISDKNCEYYFYPQQNVLVDGIDSRYITFKVQKNVEYIINLESLWRQSSGTPQFFIRRVFDDSGVEINVGTTPTTVTGKYTFLGVKTTDDLDFQADHVIAFLGDSIIRGSGVNTKLDTWTWQVRNLLRTSGIRTRIISEGYPGKTMALGKTMVYNGQCDFEKLSALVLCFGANDAIQMVTANTYVNSAKAIIDYFLGSYKNLPIIVCGSTPIQNTADEARAVAHRALLVDMVATYNNPRVKYINQGNAFIATDGANYADGLHPNATGTLAIANNFFSQWQNQEISKLLI